MDENHDKDNGPPKHEMMAWGLISDEFYTDADMDQTCQLIELLKNKYQLFEDEARGNLRHQVLGTLHQIMREWIYKAALSKGQDESSASRAGGQIFTFGSYSLGVHGPGTDIDTL